VKKLQIKYKNIETNVLKIIVELPKKPDKEKIQ